MYVCKYISVVFLSFFGSFFLSLNRTYIFKYNNTYKPLFLLLIMKANITISLDEDLVKELREKGINISSTINSYLRDFLKPKKADYKKEDLTLNIIAFGEELGLTKEQAVFTHENLNIDATYIWKNFKNDYDPVFSLYDYMEFRKKFKKRFLNEVEEIKDPKQKKAQEIIEKDAALREQGATD